MKILNVIWGFTLGAGIDKCYLTYARLSEVDDGIKMKNVCINVLSRHSHIEPLKDLGVTFIDIKSPLDISWVWKLKACIKEFKPDVFFSHGFNGAIMAFTEKLIGNMSMNIILTYHGSYHAPTKVKKLVEPIYNGLTHFIYKHVAAMTISVAEFSRQYLICKGVPSKKVVTVHNGIVDLKDINNIDIIKDKPIIVTASRIDKVKGLIYMMESIEILKKRGCIFHYYMIGEGPELDNLKRICKNKCLEDCISFLGFQNNVPSWLQTADIFAIPSLYEYHSIAILEAMRAGKAIVATTVGGNGESIRDMEEGLLVPPADSDKLAIALERLIENPELCNELARNSRNRFKQEFTEDVMMRNIVKVLRHEIS